MITKITKFKAVASIAAITFLVAVLILLQMDIAKRAASQSRHRNASATVADPRASEQLGGELALVNTAYEFPAPFDSSKAVTPDEPLAGYVIDHRSLALFDQIPEEYLHAASQLSMLFRHASVGANIDQGLDCLMNNFERRPNYCDRDLDPSQIIYSPQYDRSNWHFEFHSPPPNPNPGWRNKVAYFIDRIDGLGPAEDYDVVTFKLGYVDGVQGSDIADRFFAGDTDDTILGIEDLQVLAASHDDRTVVLWTMGLARAVGTEESLRFNEQLRAYARAHGFVLMDIADITSHSPDGDPCLDNGGRGIPALCTDYTRERNGGHLNALGSQRMAKAMWVLMARLAGWQPDGASLAPEPEPQSSSQATALSPGATPLPAESLTGTPFFAPGGAPDEPGTAPFPLSTPIATPIVGNRVEPSDGDSESPTCRGEFMPVSEALTDLGGDEYVRMDGVASGFTGGLYPDGANSRPPAHEAAGMAAAAQITPLDAQGHPHPEGKIGLMAVGMSNTAAEFIAFEDRVAETAGINPHLVIANTAQPGQTAEDWTDPQAAVWQEANARLAHRGLTPAQVQVAWVKQTHIGSGPFPQWAQGLQADLAAIARTLKHTYPNLRIAYYSSRTRSYTYWQGLNPEPAAFETGFAVKWLLAQQIEGDPTLNFDAAIGPVVAPYLSWGPYLWADGPNPRADGFTWQAADMARDCTHPSDQGEQKVAGLLLAFFRNDATARSWFLADPASTPQPTTMPTTTDTAMPAATATGTPTPEVTSTSTGDGPIIVDHRSLALFDQIPPEYLAAASNLHLLLRHASVGANIHDGLDCLMNNFQRRPHFCDRGLPPDAVVYDGKYNHTGWTFEFHSPPPNPNPGWWNKVNYFIERINNLGPGEGYDVIGFMLGL